MKIRVMAHECSHAGVPACADYCQKGALIARWINILTGSLQLVVRLYLQLKWWGGANRYYSNLHLIGRNSYAFLMSASHPHTLESKFIPNRTEYTIFTDQFRAELLWGCVSRTYRAQTWRRGSAGRRQRRRRRPRRSASPRSTGRWRRRGTPW